MHHDSQLLLQEVDNVLEAFANYSLNPSLDLISDAGLTWQENFLDKCTKLYDDFEYVKLKELEVFNKKMDSYHQVVHQMMGDLNDQDFEEIKKWFLNLKQALWNILKISDDRIKETTQALTPN